MPINTDRSRTEEWLTLGAVRKRILSESCQGLGLELY